MSPPAPPPPFTAADEHLRTEIRGFLERELRPDVPAWEREHGFPDEVFGRMAAHGLLGLKYPAEYGGSGRGYVADAILTEELARVGSGGVASGIGAHIGIATPPIWKFGTEEQKRRYLIPAIRGARIGALAITEPDAGSDVAGIRTRARRVEGGFVVNGSKMFITNGVRAHFMVTAVKTTEDGGHHGLSFLIIDRGPGVESRAIEKLGWHASDTGLISFDDVFVPEENMLGRENEGFYLIMANFQWERLLMALGAVGAMRVGLERTLPIAQQLGKQSVRHRFAELATIAQASCDLTYHALRLFVGGIDAITEVTQAKLLTQRACYELLDECLQLHYEAPPSAVDPAALADMERAVRDARLGPIGGGTDEIMREILGRSLGL